MMPEMDGFEFLEEIRRNDEWRGIPVIVITARDVTAEDRARLNGRVESIIQKAERDDMLREVRSVLTKCVDRQDRERRRGGMIKVLYVEDNEDNIYMLKNRLSREGFTVLIATDGAQGVAMAATEQPEMILMDLSLPVLDGWEATRQIKAAREDQAHPGDRALRPMP